MSKPSRSEPDSAFTPPEKVHFFQVISVPRVARVQQELVLVDAGTVKGYRVVYWYLLKDRTEHWTRRSAPAATSTSGRGWPPRAWWVTR